VDGFEPVCFALAVVTVKDIETWPPKDFAAEISKIVYFESVEDHRRILAYAVRLRVVVEVKKRSALLQKEQRFIDP
jgi:hypothetical protein